MWVQVDMAEDVKIDAHAATSTYVVFAIIFGIPVLFSFFKPGLQVRIVFGLLFCTVLLSLSRYRIVIENGILTYRSVLQKRFISLDKIRSARTEIGIDGPFSPMYRLVLKPERSSGEAPIVINMKMFEREDLTRVFDVLAPKMVGNPTSSIFGRNKAC